MPEESNGRRGLVPPLKVLRRRLDGVYRADGFSGPTRRYVLIVALLVGLASLPTLAAITAGSNELDDGSTGAMDVPFLPPPSAGPVIPIPVLPAPSTSSSGAHHSRSPRSSRRTPGEVSRPSPIPGDSGAGPSGSHSSGPASSGPVSAGSGRGAATAPPPPLERGHVPRPPLTGSGRNSGRSSGPAPHKPHPLPQKPHSAPPRKLHPASHKPQPARQEPHAVRPAPPRKSHDPDELPPPGSRPFCHERGKPGARESRHHRPDRSPHRQSEDSTHRAHWSHHREGRSRQVLVLVRSTGRHSPRTIIREHPVDVRATADRGRAPTSHRRSSLTERPQNVRPGQVLERTHNSRRHHAEHPEVPAQSRAYRGSHRAERMHRADDTDPSADVRNDDDQYRGGDCRNADHKTGADWSAAADRSSRVGRHHADHRPDRPNRW